MTSSQGMFTEWAILIMPQVVFHPLLKKGLLSDKNDSLVICLLSWVVTFLFIKHVLITGLKHSGKNK